LSGGFVGEAVLPALRDLLVNFEQLIFEMAGLLFGGIVVEIQRNFRALGEPAHCVNEADAFVFLDECEHVAAFVTAKAMKNLLMCIDVEAWRFFFVKRAKSGEICARLFQGQIRADNVHDIAGGADAFDGSWRDAGHARWWRERRSVAGSRRGFDVFDVQPQLVNQQQAKIVFDVMAGH